MYGKAVRSTVLTPSNSISQCHHIKAQSQLEFTIVCAGDFDSGMKKRHLTAGCLEMDSGVEAENNICRSS